MSQFPKLPLWTDAWVADTHHLSRQARGTYLDLLVLMWRTPGCRVPNDDTWLGARLCLTPEEVAGELRPIISEYCKSDGNSITQKRLLQEWNYVRTRRDSLSVRAKSRWGKEKTDSYSNALGRNAPIPIPIPIPIPKKNTVIAKAITPSKPPSGDFEAFWKICPRKVGRGAAVKVWPKALAKADAAAITAGMRRYASTRAGEDQQYTVHPATWLNQERWSDDLGAASQPALVVDSDLLAEEQANLKRLGIVHGV